jgi:hypothetical protein
MADINFSIPVYLSKATQDWWEKREIFDSREQLAWRLSGDRAPSKCLLLVAIVGSPVIVSGFGDAAESLLKG